MRRRPGTLGRHLELHEQILQGLLDRLRLNRGEPAAAWLEAQARINLAALSRLAQ